MIKQAFFTIAIVASAALAAGPIWPTSSADAQDSSAGEALTQITDTERTFLQLHNDERAIFGTPALTWSTQLAADAQSWADDLAKRNVMQHASSDVRKGAGENLWVGTRGRFTPQQMINAFIREKVDFRPGIFPNVAKSGDWTNVGHYTQLVWPETKEIGCAIAENRMDEFLVCRYWPAGNVRGAALGQIVSSPGIETSRPAAKSES